MKDNTDRLLEALQHPERFSDEDLESLLNDPEIRETYTLISKTSDALAATPRHDIDREWKAFADRHYSHGLAGKLLNRSAAAVITLVVVVSLAVVGATVGLRNAVGREAEATLDEMPVTDSSAIVRTEGVSKVDTTVSAKVETGETVTFKDETFGGLVDVISRHYGAESAFLNPGAKNLRLYYRWNPSLPLAEVVEELNSFEQIDITLTGDTITVR